MALTVTQVLTVLSILQYTLRVGDRIDAPTQDLLQQHEENQKQEMSWLLEEMEQRSQELHGITKESMILTACQHWWFWASAETVLLLFGLYWLPRQKSDNFESDSQQGSSSPDDEEEEEKKEEDGEEDGLEDTPDRSDTWGSYQDSG